MVFTKTTSQQSSQHIVRSHPWGQDHAAYSCPWHSDDHNPFSHSHSGCGILDKWFEMQKRRSSENTGSFPVSCYWIKPLIFVFFFYMHQSNFRTKVISNVPKAFGDHNVSSQVWLLKVDLQAGYPLQLASARPQEHRDKNNPLIPKPTLNSYA